MPYDTESLHFGSSGVIGPHKGGSGSFTDACRSPVGPFFLILTIHFLVRRRESRLQNAAEPFFRSGTHDPCVSECDPIAPAVLPFLLVRLYLPPFPADVPTKRYYLPMRERMKIPSTATGPGLTEIGADAWKARRGLHETTTKTEGPKRSTVGIPLKKEEGRFLNIEKTLLFRELAAIDRGRKAL